MSYEIYARERVHNLHQCTENHHLQLFTVILSKATLLCCEIVLFMVFAKMNVTVMYTQVRFLAEIYDHPCYLLHLSLLML